MESSSYVSDAAWLRLRATLDDCTPHHAMSCTPNNIQCILSTCTSNYNQFIIISLLQIQNFGCLVLLKQPPRVQVPNAIITVKNYKTEESTASSGNICRMSLRYFYVKILISVCTYLYATNSGYLPRLVRLTLFRTKF